ncbi:MAG: DUF3352 domain-containing protein [Kiritimatiellae bacterium]|jgi:hypothetical protein|nr:DUF3352 domain-containing protein [Kiritimatiellia bacterium]
MKLKILTVLMGVWLMTYSVEASSRASLLPRDADVLVRISNVSKLIDAMKTTSFGKLWKDPAFQAALGEYDIEKTLKQNIFSDISEEEYHMFKEEVEMLKGEVAFSYNAAKEEYAIVAAISEEDFKRSIVLDAKVYELNDERKTTVRKSVYQGVEIYAHYSKDDVEARSWQAFIDNTVLESSSEEWLKQTVTKIKSSPIQSKKDEVPSVIARAKTAKLIEKWTESIEEDYGINQPDQANAAQEVLPSKVFAAVGLNNIKELTLVIKFNADNMVMDTNLVIEKPFKGLFNILDLTPSSLSTQIPYAPIGTISYEVSRLNLMKLWQSIPETITQAVPENIAQQINSQIFGMSAMVGVDPGRDIFANLDTQFIVTSIDSSPEPENIYYIRTKNETALKSSLQRLFIEGGMIRSSLGENFKEEDFRDAHIYELGSPQTNSTFALTATSGYMVMGSGKMVRQYLRAIASNNPANKAFYNSRIFSELRKETPTQAYAYSAMDVGKYVKLFLMMTEKNASGMKLARKIPMAENNLFPEFDKSKLPSAAYMSKFFGYSLGYSIPTDKGIKSRSIVYYGKQ